MMEPSVQAKNGRANSSTISLLPNASAMVACVEANAIAPARPELPYASSSFTNTAARGVILTPPISSGALMRLNPSSAA